MKSAALHKAKAAPSKVSGFRAVLLVTSGKASTGEGSFNSVLMSTREIMKK